MMAAKRGSVAIAIVAAIAILFGAGGAAQAEQAKFKIGVILPFTGIYSSFGEFLSAGLKVAVKRINAQGGIMGREVELLMRDDASTPNRALLAARELVAEQKVDALYAGIISGTVLAVLPYTTEAKVLSIANSSSFDVGDPSRFPYSFQLSDIAQLRVPAVAAALKKIGATSTGLIVATNPPNAQLGDGLSEVLPTKYGIKVAGLTKFSATDTKDFTPLLQKMKDAGADSIVFDGIGRPGITSVMTAMQTLGWKAKVVFPSSVLSGDLSQVVPAEVASQFFGVNYRGSTRLGTAPSPAITAFIADMKALNITTSHLGWSAFAHDALYLLKWGFETAQKQYGKTDAASVAKALETIYQADYPKDYAIMYANPGYRPGDHSTRNADHSKFWSLVGASPLVDGTYVGTPLDLIGN